jgi:hypothetical protein
MPFIRFWRLINMTAKQMTAAASDKKYLRVPSSSGKASILVPVEIADTRAQFGRTDALIRPVGGSGEMWVSLDNLTSEDKPRKEDAK